MTTFTYPIDALLLLGPTGVGKSPLGDIIASSGLFGRTCRHLDFGAELRGALSDAQRSARYSDDERSFIHGVLERGLLLENERFALAKKIITLFLERAGFVTDDLLVLNGLPRHLGQARDLSCLARIHSLVVLACSADDIAYRIRENTGGDRTGRVDDHLELIEKKLSVFRERTEPLVSHYENAGATVYRLVITGRTTPEQAYQQLLLFSAAHPPVTLVAKPPQR